MLILQYKTGTGAETYNLSADVNPIDEGNTLTITLTTANVPASSSIPYTITGVSSSDINGASLTGNFTVGSGSPATDDVTFTITADATTEGPETLTLSLDNGKDSIDVDINDTSLDPTYVLSSSASSVDEGNSFDITLTTTNVTAGTSVPYTITGVSSGDINSASLTGNFTVGSGSPATDTITFNVSADAATEGLETFTLSLDNGLDTIDVDINDTSTAPTGGPATTNCAAGNFLNNTFWSSTGSLPMTWTGTAWNVNINGSLPARELTAIGTWTTGFRPSEMRIKMFYASSGLFSTSTDIDVRDTNNNSIGFLSIPGGQPTNTTIQYIVPLTFTTFDIDRIEFEIFSYNSGTQIRCIEFV